MSKFKVGDKVRVVADEKRLEELSLAGLSLTGAVGPIEGVCEKSYDVAVRTGGGTWGFSERDLELVEDQQNLFRVRESDDKFDTWVVADGPDRKTTHQYIQNDGTINGDNEGDTYPTKIKAQVVFDLYLKKQQEPEQTFVGHPDGELEVKDTGAPQPDMPDGTPPDLGAPNAIRTFGTGATRDTIQGKLDYVKALSPIVLRRYVQYLDKHRLQPDGFYRDFDNWKKGIPQETYHSSKARHFVASWLIEEGYKVSDNHGPIDEEDALCGEIFNAMGKLHEILKAKLKPVDRTAPTPGGY